MLNSAPDGYVVDGRYRVVEKVGAGGAASVYRATDLRLRRDVALKVLHPGLVNDHELVERFRREAESAASLNHRHIVAIYARGECDDTHYIAMEYVAGRSLKSVIAQEAPLDEGRAIDLTVQILRAAGAMHSRGIVHRDLKPHNAVVDPAGGVKVIDFGIARAGASDITEAGAICGSAHYLSPEQAEGADVTAASDLYSVGVVLYEALVGRPPFHGDAAVTVALKHITEPPVRPLALNPAVTPELDATVMRALEKDPMRRFADAAEFIDALTGREPAPQRKDPRHEHHIGSRNHHAREDRARGVSHRVRHLAAWW
jgi:eukaryotic-like serine/threonine-protein kinase